MDASCWGVRTTYYDSRQSHRTTHIDLPRGFLLYIFDGFASFVARYTNAEVGVALHVSFPQALLVGFAQRLRHGRSGILPCALEFSALFASDGASRKPSHPEPFLAVEGGFLENAVVLRHSGGFGAVVGVIGTGSVHLHCCPICFQIC